MSNVSEQFYRSWDGLLISRCWDRDPGGPLVKYLVKRAELDPEPGSEVRFGNEMGTDGANILGLKRTL